MKKVIFLFLLAGIAFLAVFFLADDGKGTTEKNDSFSDCVINLKKQKAQYLQENGIGITLENKSLRAFDYKVSVDDDMKLLLSEKFMEDIMGCSVNVYKSGNVKVNRAGVEIEYLKDDIEISEGEIYIPANDDINKLGYSYDFSFKDDSVAFTNTDNGNYLPDAYDMRNYGRVSQVRDQGKFGTCWAFASLGALETVTLPGEENIYSVDHMSMNNGYTLDISEGGEHNMSIAYLASWQGPVLDEDDKYGDGVTDKSLTAVKHLEEAIVIKERDDNKVKSAIFKYGGVETSVYLEMPYGSSTSAYYNDLTSSYYYNGKEKPNHDIVIVGWNDHYPRKNFTIMPKHDGAFICKNSWGTGFGERGYFYVSYEDVNICSESIVYTRLVENDNYDNIYQTDLLGWVGQMGFSDESAYFANVYTAEKDEILKAVSFYSTGDDTSFKVFVVTDYKDSDSLNSGRQEVGKGETRYSGYYTVDLKQDIELKKGQKYAVIVSIKTPGSEKPIAIECDAGERTRNLDLKDGEGYISRYGEVWHSAEEAQANVCLKAFTDDK